MRNGRYLSALVVVTLALATGAVAADDGPGSGSSAPVIVDAGVTDAAPTPDAGPPPAPAPQTLPANEDLAKSFYEGVLTKNWFLLAGVVLAYVISASRWLLIRKWPQWEGSHYGVFLAAGISGVTAVSLAWIADEPVASTTTFMGAWKLFAAATFAYVVPKKIAQASPPDPTVAPSSGGPTP